MQRLSNHTKAVLFSENLLEQQVIRRDNATVVMHLDYTLGRPRNDFGTPYGRMSGSKMLVTVRVGTKDTKEYYERLTMNESQTFTIVFNATYDEWGMLANYESAMRGFNGLDNVKGIRYVTATFTHVSTGKSFYAWYESSYAAALLNGGWKKYANEYEETGIRLW